MRTKLSVLCLFVLCLGLCGTCFAAEAEAEAEVKVTPKETEMALEVDKTVKQFDPVTNPESALVSDGFRGADPNSGDKHWLEDAGVLMSENSNLYNTDAAGIDPQAEFKEPPQINWTINKECPKTCCFKQASEAEAEKPHNNSNQATNECNIKCPGYYEVHNGGARQVSSPNCPLEDGTVGTGTQTVTAQARQGIQVHDCTAPDVWVAFEECAGNTDVDKSIADLEAEIKAQIIPTEGREGGCPFSLKPEDYQSKSYLYVYEGDDGERDLLPGKKQARITLAGPMFSDKGVVEVKSGKIDSQIGTENLTNKVTLEGGVEGVEGLEGIFVRRNVPFICCSVAVDNANRTVPVTVKDSYIETSDGERLDEETSYVFRVPNYPREEYKDQPDYYFIANTSDTAGNSTSIKMPLYVLDTQTAFEGGKNQ